MFTGIIEDIGLVESINSKSISVSTKLDQIKIGDSISVNGICLTVTNLIRKKSLDRRGQNNFSILFFDISKETFNRTNIKFIQKKHLVNLERALTLTSRLSGHIVTGHIDGITKIKNIKKVGNGWEFYFDIPNELDKFITKKGSVAIDGISLTIANKTSSYFSVAVVPFTYENTNLKNRKNGDVVNLEIDVLARYIYSILKNEQIQNVSLMDLTKNEKN